MRKAGPAAGLGGQLRRFGVWGVLVVAAGASGAAGAQGNPAEAKAAILAAVQTEMSADRPDHTAFQYYDHDITPDHDVLYYVVETPQGVLQRKVEDHGRPLTPQEQHADELRMHALVNDRSAQQKLQKDSSHDDNQAEQMLELLPDAFTWSVAGSQTAELLPLSFRPDPDYSPSSMEARVFAAMAGQVVVDRREQRIYSIRGRLIQDVKFGLGLFGRLRSGGTFEVERREVVPGHWQMTESHVHLSGKALFFKTIGSQEDEARWGFKVSEAKTLAQAYEILVVHWTGNP